MDTSQVIDNNQIHLQANSPIIYQQNSQPNQTIQTNDGQIHYIVQEEDLQSDNYNLVPQQATQQVYYQKISTENGQQIIQQHHGRCFFF